MCLAAAMRLACRGSVGDQAMDAAAEVSSSLPTAELLRTRARETLVDGFAVPEARP